MLSTLPAYAELHCRSNFSFLSGASHPEELIGRAQALRYEALALTDECSFAGSVRAHVEAERLGMRCLVGVEMRLGEPGDGEPRLVLLAESRRGYGNLVRWVTLARRRAAKGEYLAQRSEWRCTTRESHSAQEKDECDYEYQVWETCLLDSRRSGEIS